MITHVYPVSLGIKGRHLNANLFFEVHFSAWPRNWPCKFLLCGQTAVTTLQRGRSLSLTLPQSSPVSLLNKWGKRMQAACVGRWWQGGGGGLRFWRDLLFCYSPQRTKDNWVWVRVKAVRIVFFYFIPLDSAVKLMEVLTLHITSSFLRQKN